MEKGGSGYVALDASPGTATSCDRVFSLLGQHIAEGDTPEKVVHCAKHYGAALFSNGRLLLLAPESSRQHGVVIMGGNGDDGGGAVVRDVAAGDTHIVFCMDDGAVFSFGYSNKHGQLGDGTVWESWSSDFFPPCVGDNDDDLPRLCAPRRISGFGCGGGSGSESETGGEEGEVIEGKRYCVPVVAVACGAFHTLLLTAGRNCVYGCGLGVRGQLGGKRRPLLQPSFKSIRLLFGLPVRQIAAAGGHSFVLLRTGKLLAFGDNTCGQLGFGTTCMVGTPTAVTFSGGARGGEKRRPLDSFALKGLRAAFGTVESMYYPLRVERISPELDPAEPLVVSVWCCATRSLVLTGAMEWLSCGLPLSQAPLCNFDGSCRRMDRHGALGRWMRQKAEAMSFAKMQWSERVAVLLGSAFPGFREGGAPVEAALGRVRAACTSHAVALLVPNAAGGAGARALFLQGGGRDGAELVENGRRTLLAPAFRAELLLQRHGAGNDSSEYALMGVQAIVACDGFLVAV